MNIRALKASCALRISWWECGGVWPGALHLAAALGRHARTARLRSLLGLPPAADEHRRGPGRILVFCCGRGHLALLDFPVLHRPVDYADLLRHRGDLRRA